MDEVEERVETPFVVPIFAMVNIGMGLVLLIRSGYFLSSGTSDKSIGLLAAVGIVELIVGLGLAAQMRWAWFATVGLIPINLVIAVVLWFAASAGTMLAPVVIYGLSAVVLFVPLPWLRAERDQIWAWSATRWNKRPERVAAEPSSEAGDERSLAA